MPYIRSQQSPNATNSFGSLLTTTDPQQSGSSRTDALTGLPGMTEFYRLGTPIVDRCLADGRPSAVAIIDVDHLQRINETHGHRVGDRVLNLVGSCLKTIAADTPHLVARLGEEEFGLLLVDLDNAAAAEFCEMLRSAIAAIPVNVANADISVPVSIGLAEIHGEETFDNYLNAAEQFLFMAKSNGRNQVFSDYTMLAGIN